MAPLLTADDIAEQLGVSTKLVYKLVTGNKIPYVRVGQRNVRFRPESIERWLADQEQDR